MFHRKSFFLFPYFDRKNGFCLCFHQLLIVKKSCPLKSVNMVELAFATKTLPSLFGMSTISTSGQLGQ